jgi:hypothetical protein
MQNSVETWTRSLATTSGNQIFSSVTFLSTDLWAFRFFRESLINKIVNIIMSNENRPLIQISMEVSTIDHCRSRCKGRGGPPLIHSFIQVWTWCFDYSFIMCTLITFLVARLHISEPSTFGKHQQSVICLISQDVYYGHRQKRGFK